MDLYFRPLACSMASRIALYEAGLDAGYIRAGGPDFQDINPMALVPVLRTDGGAVLTENVAVLAYLADLAPQAGLDGGDRHQLLRWLAFISTELHKAIFLPLLTATVPDEVKAFARTRVDPPFATLSDHLAGRETLLNGFSVADAYLLTVLNWARLTRVVELESWPVLSAYLERLLQRPAVARAQAEEYALYRDEKAGRAA